MKVLNVALCGNPNVGKSTVFNALTGLRQHTGNWAGKTVESARGRVRGGEADWTLNDLPGAYSLLNGSPEEVVAGDFLAYQPLDAAVAVCDATCLRRNLNLALQAAQLCPRTVVCVNMMDEAEKRGIVVDLERLEAALGVPVVGASAGRGRGLRELKRRVTQAAEGGSEPQGGAPAAGSKAAPLQVRYGDELEAALDALAPLLARRVPALACGAARFQALRLLAGDDAALDTLAAHIPAADREAALAELRLLLAACRERGLTAERVTVEVVGRLYAVAEEACRDSVREPENRAARDGQLRLDRALCDKRVSVPLMLCLLAVVFFITLRGANAPSAWLSDTLLGWEPAILGWLLAVGVPQWLSLALTQGVYRVMAWVVSVMLPPMAIFFPLFTLLEDFGFLPRVAFNLDRCFQRCRACGKQALCICMGFGCNAVGVIGCRIIQSPRERLIAILTNSFVPCNGRFPTLIALIGIFFVTVGGLAGTLLSALALVGLIVLAVLMTLAASYLLSRTVLRGMPSAFSLELPPFRRPRVAQVLVRSLLDRTLFVLGRAVAVAAPAGLILWLLANVSVGGAPLLTLVSGFLDPLGRLMGMDGVILLAFVLGFPANEIVLPIAMMIYLSQGALADTGGLEALGALLAANGWTARTALCAAIFSMFHWPCSTTLITIRRETKSMRWTALAALLPTLIGFVLCVLTTLAWGLWG